MIAQPKATGISFLSFYKRLTLQENYGWYQNLGKNSRSQKADRVEGRAN